MTNRLIHFIAFGCLGITTEVMFTATGSAIRQWQESGSIELALRGHSYVWMFFIYALAALLFPAIFPSVSKFPLIIRLLIYMTGIFVIEYLAGWFLEITTGSCPWHYDTGWSVSGYIRLDYGPFWMVFGLILETVFRKMNSLLPVITPD